MFYATSEKDVITNLARSTILIVLYFAFIFSGSIDTISLINENNMVTGADDK